MWIKLVELITLAWITVLMLRLLLQRGGLHLSHPLAQFCASLSDWAIKPVRRLIKPTRGWDMAIVGVAFFVLLLVRTIFAVVVIFQGFGFGWSHAALVVADSLLLLTQTAAYALMICLIIRTVLSFSDPYNSLMRVLSQLLSPWLKPFSRLRSGRMDFSGAVVLLLLWLWVGAIVPEIRHRLLTVLFF